MPLVDVAFAFAFGPAVVAVTVAAAALAPVNLAVVVWCGLPFRRPVAFATISAAVLRQESGNFLATVAVVGSGCYYAASVAHASSIAIDAKENQVVACRLVAHMLAS